MERRGKATLAVRAHGPVDGSLSMDEEEKQERNRRPGVANTSFKLAPHARSLACSPALDVVDP